MSTPTAGFVPLDFAELPADEMSRRATAFHQLMRRRRTVRHFDSRPLPPDVVEQALLTAGSAPSGANRQPWHFVVVTDADKKAAIREAAEKEEQEFYRRRASREWLEALAPLGTDENKPFLTTAPVLIAIFLRRFNVDTDGKRLKNYYTAESVGIATGMLIAALHQAGVATLTHTPSPMRFLNRLLDRPAHERAFLLLVAGFPSPDAEVPDIGKYPLEELATFA
ncbi:MAG: nitroreductase family protein [Pseudomonadales bacterium]|nr:nitroreductase family protein [Pseudomonadales bacterium]